jgi:predicted deacylase
VYDDLALADACALYRFLQRRCIVHWSSMSPANTYTSPPAPIMHPTVRDACPLSGVDMIKPSKMGVVAWKVRPGQEVSEGQVLGEIVDMEYIDEPREPIISRTSGIVFGMRTHKLVRPGQIIIKVAGRSPLPWRKGKMLTSR